MLDDLPNVMIVQDQNEKVEDIIDDYFEMIMKFKDKDPEVIKELLYDFFDDVNYWTIKQVLIDQAKLTLSHLQTLEECEHEFIEDMDDE